MRAFVRAQLEDGPAGIELPAAPHVHAAATSGDLAALLALDGLLDELKPVAAARSASTRVGTRLLDAAGPLLDAGMVAQDLEAIRDGRGRGHHAVAFAATMQAAGLGAAATALALAAGAVSGYIAAAVRLGVTGQTAAQEIVAGQHPPLGAVAARSSAVPLAGLGGYLPLVDLAGLQQERLGGGCSRREDETSPPTMGLSPLRCGGTALTPNPGPTPSPVRGRGDVAHNVSSSDGMLAGAPRSRWRGGRG